MMAQLPAIGCFGVYLTVTGESGGAIKRMILLTNPAAGQHLPN